MAQLASYLKMKDADSLVHSLCMGPFAVSLLHSLCLGLFDVVALPFALSVYGTFLTTTRLRWLRLGLKIVSVEIACQSMTISIFPGALSAHGTSCLRFLRLGLLDGSKCLSEFPLLGFCGLVV